MLLRQNRCGHKIDDLFSLLDRLECSADGNFCLSVSHIPADQPVHDLCTLHIMLCIFNGLNLVLRLLKRKHLFEFLLPHRIRPVDKSLGLLPGRIEFHQIFRYCLNCFLYLVLRLSPLDGTQFVKLRFFSICSGIFLDQVHLRYRNIEYAPICICNLHIIFDDFLHLDLLYAFIDSDSVIFMDHIVAGLKFGKILDLLSLIFLSAFLLFLSSKDIRLRDDHELQHGILVPLRHIPVCHHDLSGIHLTFHIFAVETAKIVIPQIFCKTFCPCSGSGKQDNPVSAPFQALQIPGEQLKTVIVRVYSFCLYTIDFPYMEQTAL